MEKLQFKTNINCMNCVRAVTNFIEDVPGIDQWEVDTSVSDKILTIKGDSLNVQGITQAVEEAGFEISPLESTP